MVDIYLAQNSTKSIFFKVDFDAIGGIAKKTYDSKNDGLLVTFIDESSDRYDYSTGRIPESEHENPVQITISDYEHGKNFEGLLEFNYHVLRASGENNSIGLKPDKFKFKCCIEDLDTPEAECPN